MVEVFFLWEMNFNRRTKEIDWRLTWIKKQFLDFDPADSEKIDYEDKFVWALFCRIEILLDGAFLQWYGCRCEVHLINGQEKLIIEITFSSFLKTKTKELFPARSCKMTVDIAFKREIMIELLFYWIVHSFNNIDVIVHCILRLFNWLFYFDVFHVEVEIDGI